MAERFIYELQGPSPPERNGFGMWGFGALLDKNFAIKLREININQENCDRLNNEGSMIITKYGLDDMGKVTPYCFLEGSWLLQGIKVPGNSCDLSLKCRDHESFLQEAFEKEKESINRRGSILIPVTYVSHNVDSKEQAFCLSSLFTNWANQVNMVFNN